MRAALIWGQADARRRIGALIGIALLITLAGGATLASFAGARRAASSFERLRVRTKAMDAAVFGTPEQTRAATSDRRVAAYAPFSMMAVVAVDDSSLFPFVAPGSPAIGRTIERPLILEGRRADPRRADEIVVPEAVAAQVGKHVGDTMRFVSALPKDVDPAGSARPNTDGPRFRVRVVGVSRSPAGLSVRARDIQFIYFTDAWRSQYGGRIGEVSSGTIVRLRGGSDAFGAWSRSINQAGDTHAQPLFSSAPVEDSISVIVDGLRLFAVIAAIVGFVAAFQAVNRHTAGSATDLDVLRTLGLRHGPRAAASLLGVAPAIVVGVLGAFLAASAWSPQMPIGLARRAEPDLGFSFDAFVLVGGALVMFSALLLVTAVSAWRVSMSRSASHVTGPDVSAPRLLGLPPVAAIGLHLATRRGGGRSSVPIRSAMTGVAVAIAGVIATSIFVSGLHRLVSTPSRYGVPWDATVFHNINTNNSDSGAGAADGLRLAKIREVERIAVVRAQLGGLLDGRNDGSGVAIEPTRGDLAAVVTSGRAPRAADEIALGFDTAHRLGKQHGGRVRLTGTSGSRSMRVVGVALLPTVDDPAALASGFLVVPGAARSLGLATDDSFSRYAVAFATGVTRAQGARALVRAGFEVSTPSPPPEVARLRDVESLPFVLALILAVIGAVVVVLALFTTVRRRRRDLALLQVFGFRRRQVTGSVIMQALVFAIVGLVFGIPLGLLLGRAVWQHIAEALGVASDPALPVGAIALAALGVVVVAAVASVIPASRASRLHPAKILRDELASTTAR